MTSSNEDEPPKKIPMKFKLFKLYDFNVYDGFSKQTDFDKSNFDPYKDNIIEVNTTLKMVPSQNVKHKILGEITGASLVSIDKDFNNN